jgi:hypothetical protein
VDIHTTVVLLANASLMRALIALASKLADRQWGPPKETAPGSRPGPFKFVDTRLKG